MNYLNAIQRRVKEIELLRWVYYLLHRPLNCLTLKSENNECQNSL